MAPCRNVFSAIVFALLTVFSFQAKAEFMTVQQLRDLLDKGDVGELIATTYVQGVVDGMLGVDSLRKQERGDRFDFCKLHDEKIQMPHPAYKAKDYIMAWEKRGLPMNTIAPDFVLAFMTSEYGC